MTKLLLIGTEDVHLSVLRLLQRKRINNVEIILIGEKKNNTDFSTVCKNANVTFIEDTIISFDPLQKMLLSFSGEIYRFDVISFNVDMKVSLFKQALVPVDAQGLMMVEDTLQNTEFPFLFGAGHCVTIAGQPNSAGDIEIQAEVLWQNIKLYLAGRPLKRLESQNNKSSFINKWIKHLYKK
ncbi:hypothetical protein AWM68_01815 [Fictibacillus phosphorivorans]|uniref:Uncharacterized protein n=1 Tax=Fictibacillus phosphorivorans TaxID=1221500 RepID=A0A163SGK5_9BACL|nr:hypothetical protein [Fictibacillus phosphorivorans]KZE69029.1 hypothetical protein AWM68_01815 [Fictibacillus phosphorivorans]